MPVSQKDGLSAKTTLGDVVPDLIAILVVAVLVAAQSRNVQGLGFEFRSETGIVEHEKLIDPAIGSGWAVAFYALVALSVGAAIVRYLRGFWTMPVMVLEVVDSAMWVVYAVALAVSGPIVNPELTRRLDEAGQHWISNDRLSLIIVIVVAVISIQAAWEAVQGHREYRRMDEGTVGRIVDASRAEGG